MSTRQIGSELRMLAACLLLGSLVLRKPSAPEPVVVRIAEPPPTPRRRLLGLTQNALVTGVIAAVVSGAISFAVAHQQTHDAARQAVAGQQVQEVIQLEADTKAYFEYAQHTYFQRFSCQKTKTPECKKLPINGGDLTVQSYVIPIASDIRNVTDSELIKDATEFTQAAFFAIIALPRAGAASNAALYALFTSYGTVINRCGLLIQGKT